MTDHSTILGLVNKSIHDIENPRILAGIMKIRLFPKAVFSYIKGKLNYAADALSRYPRWGVRYNHDPMLIYSNSIRQVKYVLGSTVYRYNDRRMVEIRKAVRNDLEYLKLKEAVLQGRELKSLDGSNPAWAVKAEYNNLSCLDEADATPLVIDYHKILVPKEYIPKVIKQLHLAHASDSTMYMQCKGSYYWPNMNNQLTEVYRSSQSCHLYSRQKTKDKLRMDYSDRSALLPWEEVCVDIGQFRGQKYMIAVDRASSYPTVTRL